MLFYFFIPNSMLNHCCIPASNCMCCFGLPNLESTPLLRFCTGNQTSDLCSQADLPFALAILLFSQPLQISSKFKKPQFQCCLLLLFVCFITPRCSAHEVVPLCSVNTSINYECYNRNISTFDYLLCNLPFAQNLF